MKPEQKKAQELKNKFRDLAPDVVDEILKSEPLSPCNTNNCHVAYRQAMVFWTNVKKELEK